MAKIRNKQPDADAGRVIVDEQLEGLEARLTSIYGQTAKEVQADLDKFLAKYQKEDAEKQAMVEADEMTKEEYIDWRERQIFRTNAMNAKIDDLTARCVNADKQAMAMVNKQLPETYATSYNFGGYRAEAMAHNAGFDYTQFTIFNQDAVRTLATEDPDLIPWKPDVDVAEDEKWNRKHVQEAIQQGIVKGDSMDDVAKRLLPVVNMDKNAAIRTARTAVNGIENKGRKDATERVKAAGIPMVEMWSCTHDNRTRDTHILLDGTTADDNGMFGKGILTTLIAYPGDPAGDPAEVYNCRCGLSSTIKGIDHSKDDELYAKMMEEEYFDDWLKVKEEREEKEAAFQAKKEGAEERLAEKRAKAEEQPEISEADLSKFGLEKATDFDAEEFNYIDTRYGKYQYELAQEMEEFMDEDTLFVKIDDGKHEAYAAIDPETNSLEGIVSTGGGQGTELLGRVMEYQESQGEGLMWLADNPDSVSYYEHLGLGEFGTGDKNEKLYEISAEDMSKALEKVNEHRDIPEETEAAAREITPVSSEEAEQLLLKESKDWVSDLTEEEKTEVQAYSDYSYESINRYLRTENETDKEGIKKYNPGIDDRIERLDSAIDKFELKDDIKVYRVAEINVNKYDVGDTYHDNGYGSSAIDDNSVEIWSELELGNCLFEIDVPAGEGRGAYIDEISLYQGQKEFLMARDSDFEITGKRYDEDLGLTVFEARMRVDDQPEEKPENNEDIINAIHVTKDKNINAILNEGFDLSHAGEGAGTVWGDGVYFSTGEIEQRFYSIKTESKNAVEADIDTSEMLHIDLGTSVVKSPEDMYKTAVKQLPEELQKEYKQVYKELKKDDPWNARKDAFETVAKENYTGLVITQDLDGSIDPLSGGNQIVIYDTSVIDIKGKVNIDKYQEQQKEE